MEFIKPFHVILDEIDGDKVLSKIEFCGRVCYKSEELMTADSAKKFVRSIIQSGHESVLEHFSFSVRFVVSRAIANEIVRHRIASYSQESTRYCNYKNRGVEIVIPQNMNDYYNYEWICGVADEAYKELLENGYKPEIARGILPLDLKTELIMTTNLREWRHFLKLRCDSHAHPEMRRVTIPLLDELHTLIPVVFDDIYASIHNEANLDGNKEV